MLKEQYQITIKKFVSSYKSPFWLQLGTREKPHAYHPETEAERCSRWVRCEPSTPRRDLKIDELARSIEGALSSFFQTTAVASTIEHVCQAHSEAQAEKGQCVLCKPPGVRELRIVQEAQSWRPIPMEADLLRCPAEPLTERVRGGAHH